MKHASRIVGGLLVLGTPAVLLVFWLDRTETTTDAYVTGRILLLREPPVIATPPAVPPLPAVR